MLLCVCVYVYLFICLFVYFIVGLTHLHFYIKIHYQQVYISIITHYLKASFYYHHHHILYLSQEPHIKFHHQASVSSYNFKAIQPHVIQFNLPIYY